MHQTHVPQDTTSLVSERKEERDREEGKAAFKSPSYLFPLSHHLSPLRFARELSTSSSSSSFTFLVSRTDCEEKSLVTRGVLTISQNIH